MELPRSGRRVATQSPQPLGTRRNFPATRFAAKQKDGPFLDGNGPLTWAKRLVLFAFHLFALHGFVHRDFVAFVHIDHAMNGLVAGHRDVNHIRPRVQVKLNW